MKVGGLVIEADAVVLFEGVEAGLVPPALVAVTVNV